MLNFTWKVNLFFSSEHELFYAFMFDVHKLHHADAVISAWLGQRCASSEWYDPIPVMKEGVHPQKNKQLTCLNNLS